MNLTRDEIRFFSISFSQFGEDLSVNRWADELDIRQGTYLDIGAFHPIHLSNTLLLKKKGWHGVNIDMNPEKIARFNVSRPEDDNLCCAISSEERQYIIKNKGRTTEHIEFIEDANNAPESEALYSIPIEKALIGTMIQDGKIDYLNIDCEGHDFAVLKQIELSKYNISIITIEALDAVSQKNIVEYMLNRGYCLCEKIHWTLLFIPANKAMHLTSLAEPNA
jgi:FkbM family methyltransferase